MQQQLLDELSEIGRGWDIARRKYHKRLAPDFVLIDLFDTGETRLSQLIAFLLDPAANHAQATFSCGRCCSALG